MKKFITKFDTTAELTTFSATTDFGKPHVSLTENDSKVHYFGYLTHNGHEYVDLGLSSGLKWATCNVGANSPEEYGLYFAWGETTGYTADDVTSGVRKFDGASYTASAISTNLTLNQDAAHINLSGNWRMPTSEEYQELLDSCNVMWTDDYYGTGVAGCVFTSKLNENSVFFPATGVCDNSSINVVGSLGLYWSTSWESSSTGRCLGFDTGSHNLGNNTRYYGFSVRGVFK